MKRGYSNLLGEIVPADEIDHEDTAPFQIVCEECREPVYKVQRGESHFLSHYPSAVEWASDCEMRVERSIRDNGDRTMPEVDRAQTLEHYLSIFGNMLRSLANHVLDPAQPFEQEIMGKHWLRTRTRAMNRFRQLMDEGFIHLAIDDRLDDEWKAARSATAGGVELTYEASDTMERFPTRLQRRVQRERAMDMARSLCTGPMVKNLALLAGLSWIQHVSAFEKRHGEIGKRILGIPVYPAALAAQVDREMREAGIEDQVMLSVAVHMIGILTRLDYIGFLPKPDGTIPTRTSVSLPA
jgi:hypothetical protein